MSDNLATLLTKETFLPLLNSKFKLIFDNENSYEVELIEITDGPNDPKFTRGPFSLLFRADRDKQIFNQGTYTLCSDALEKMDLFVCPRQSDKHGIYYEIIVN